MSWDCGDELDVVALTFRDRPGLHLQTVRPSFAGERVLAAAWPALLNPAVPAKVQGQALARVAEALGPALLEWDMLRFGVPVPATAEGLQSLHTSLLLDLVTAWVENVAISRPAAAQVEAAPDPDVAALHDIPTVTLPGLGPDREPLDSSAVDVEPDRAEALEPVGA